MNDKQPCILLINDKKHGNEFRIGIDSQGSGIVDMQDLDFNGHDDWYFCENGTFVYPGHLRHFIEALIDEGIPYLIPD
jgi:hypothetical protein